jgi:hypothetical protein
MAQVYRVQLLTDPGFLQQAFQASNRSFFDEQGNPIVAPQQVAGLSPDQQRAIQLSRQATGVQTPFLEEAGQSYRAGYKIYLEALTQREVLVERL